MCCIYLTFVCYKYCFKDEVRRSILSTNTLEEEEDDIGRSYSEIILTNEKEGFFSASKWSLSIYRT